MSENYLECDALCDTCGEPMAGVKPHPEHPRNRCEDCVGNETPYSAENPNPDKRVGGL